MLPKTRRLNLKKDFKWVVLGKKAETDNLKIYWRLGTNKFPKIGIAISKNYFKKSSERVEAKRRCFAAAKAHYASLPNNLNLVIMPKTAVLNKEQNQLVAELENVPIHNQPY